MERGTCSASGGGGGCTSRRYLSWCRTRGRIDPTDPVFQRRSYPIAPIVVVSKATEVTSGLSDVAEIVRIGAESLDLADLMRYLANERGGAAAGVRGRGNLELPHADGGAGGRVFHHGDPVDHWGTAAANGGGRASGAAERSDAAVGFG